MIICIMLNEAKTTPLGHVADLRLGYPFRGAVPARATGSVHVVQISDLSRTGLKDRNNLLVTELPSRREPDWLLDQDVLFIARGPHTYASLMTAPPPRTVCTPHIYVIRVTQRGRLLPAFLAWQLNQPPAQRYLRQSAEGSHQLSIRRGVLEQTPIRILPLAQQHAAIELGRIAQAERCHLESLIKNRDTELALLAERLLT